MIFSKERWNIEVHVPSELLSGMMKRSWMITMLAVRVADSSSDITTFRFSLQLSCVICIFCRLCNIITPR